jgi:diguanylate cyclase (GGDEF)-like protein
VLFPRARRTSIQVLVAGVATSVGCVVLLLVVGVPLDQAVVVLCAGLLVSAATVATTMWQNGRHQVVVDHLERTQHQAVTDPLTGLRNRSGLFAELEHSIAEVRRSQTVMGVLFLDLDRFKVVNDSMGHDVGDELLRIVAARLRNTVRSSDFVARFGGDEFVIVCRGLLSAQSVEQVARSILASFTQPIALQGAAQVVSTSIGIAVADAEDPRSPEELVRDADVAMFKAKRARAGYAVFDEAERMRAVDRLDIERELLQGLAEGQLTVYYQPIVALPRCEAVGFEALVRWNHPSRGLLAPAAFLDVAEDAGLMSVIGELVLREACAQKAVWNHLSARADELTISVNVAEQQLRDPSFAQQVAATLDWAGLPPEQLTLEITEGIVAANLTDLRVLKNLAELGVTLAIDDFGTGQSSLALLRQLDMVSILKIDREFVNGLRRGVADSAIVEAIVSMAAALELTVVAEGVEDRRQLAQLRRLGVDLIQGYLFNHPLPANDIRPGAWVTDQASVRQGLDALEVSRSLLEERRSRSAPRPLRRAPVRGPGRS